MENNVRRIGLGITSYNYARQEEEAAKSAPEKQTKAPAEEQKKLAANDVLGYMAAVNADLVPVKTQRTVDVNKYVTPAQEARIAGFMKGFEADIEEAYETISRDFPNLTENAKLTLASAAADNLYSRE